MKSTILKAIAIAICVMPTATLARVSHEMKVWNAQFVNPGLYEYQQALKSEMYSQKPKINPNNIYKIRTGKDLTKLFKREGYRRISFSADCPYIATIHGQATLNPHTSKLEFIGVEQSTYYLFETLMSVADFPYAYADLMQSDTLSFSFDFKTIIRGKQRRGKEVINSYMPPMFKGEETPYEWIKEVLGEENCKLLKSSKSNKIMAKVSVTESGEAFAEMLYITVPIELNMDAVTTPKHRWSPTIINGKAVALDHVITFEVKKL